MNKIQMKESQVSLHLDKNHKVVKTVKLNNHKLIGNRDIEINSIN